MGFYLGAGLRPKYGRNFFSPMSMHKEFNSTSISLYYPSSFFWSEAFFSRE